MQTLSFDVSGMTCGGCTGSVQRALSKIDGVSHAGQRRQLPVDARCAQGGDQLADFDGACFHDGACPPCSAVCALAGKPSWAMADSS